MSFAMLRLYLRAFSREWRSRLLFRNLKVVAWGDPLFPRFIWYRKDIGILCSFLGCMRFWRSIRNNGRIRREKRVSHPRACNWKWKDVSFSRYVVRKIGCNVSMYVYTLAIIFLLVFYDNSKSLLWRNKTAKVSFNLLSLPFLFFFSSLPHFSPEKSWLRKRWRETGNFLRNGSKFPG